MSVPSVILVHLVTKTAEYVMKVCVCVWVSHQHVVHLLLVARRVSCQQIQHLTLAPFTEIPQPTMDKV